MWHGVGPPVSLAAGASCRPVPRPCRIVTSSSSESRPLTVPRRHVKAFEHLREMQEGDFSHLLMALNTAESTARLRTLAESAGEGSQLDVSDVQALLEAIRELAGIGYRIRSSAGQIAARVVSSPQFSADEDLNRHDTLRERMAKRIETLLNCEVIRFLSKASSIGAEHERVFLNAQVLTDLRPLFDDDRGEDLEPEGALLCHTLSLHFISSDRTHDTFYVVLDDDDIETLQSAIDRAIRKSGSLKRKLQDAGLVHMTSE